MLLLYYGDNMIKVKNILLVAITVLVIGGIFSFKDRILDTAKEFMEPERKIIIDPGNNYVKKDTFLFVKQSKDYIPYNYDDLKDIFYSILNQGWTEFTFYCPTEYSSCLDDVSSISNDKVLLSDINNYVHPYNSYSSIRTVFDDTGEVTIFVNRLYSSTEILELNSNLDKIMEDNISEDMDLEEKVKVLHDYVVMNTTYDSDRADNGNSNYDSARMTGALYEHYAICSGYTDLMAVMLERLNIPNFKIASDTHIWNAVYINNEWLHLDLTWDDPVSALGEDNYDDTFFLIDTNTLKEKDNKTTDHVFDTSRYLEFS